MVYANASKEVYRAYPTPIPSKNSKAALKIPEFKYGYGFFLPRTTIAKAIIIAAIPNPFQ